MKRSSSQAHKPQSQTPSHKPTAYTPFPTSTRRSLLTFLLILITFILLCTFLSLHGLNLFSSIGTVTGGSGLLYYSLIATQTEDEELKAAASRATPGALTHHSNHHAVHHSHRAAAPAPVYTPLPPPPPYEEHKENSYESDSDTEGAVAPAVATVSVAAAAGSEAVKKQLSEESSAEGAGHDSASTDSSNTTATGDSTSGGAEGIPDVHKPAPKPTDPVSSKCNMSTVVLLAVVSMCSCVFACAA